MNRIAFSVLFFIFFVVSPIMMCGQAPYTTKSYIKIKDKAIFLNVGQSDSVFCISDLIDSHSTLLWRSLMPQVASVDANGIVTAKRYGRTHIIAYTADNKVADTCIVVVNKCRTFLANGICFNMIYVQGGTFWMGAQSEDEDGQNYNFYAEDDYERPVHRVTLSDYYIGETEVTQALWEAVMQAKPTVCGERWCDEYGVGSELPAYFVSWNDCQDFIDRLNMLLEKQLKGHIFVLPSEAQWEFAARGGVYATMKNGQYCHSYSGCDNPKHVAWFGNGKGRSRAVKTKRPNELGLYDMSGNVDEWCADMINMYVRKYESDQHVTNPIGNVGFGRVRRGGNWYLGQQACRSTSRSLSVSPKERHQLYGLRMALVKRDKYYDKRNVRRKKK